MDRTDAKIGRSTKNRVNMGRLFSGGAVGVQRAIVGRRRGGTADTEVFYREYRENDRGLPTPHSRHFVSPTDNGSTETTPPSVIRIRISCPSSRRTPT